MLAAQFPLLRLEDKSAFGVGNNDSNPPIRAYTRCCWDKATWKLMLYPDVEPLVYQLRPLAWRFALSFQ
ncbi:hypothetical protein E3N88_20361 [Mikania micrantha]|uniref:Uncharacterized protein n=1 Tax=Mikania micrantha TaxID=192012 RepID=A0A5N6NJJ7_9ASTR|nr:hypothetical protein E3N88_20361 [Mikania micrantha]